METHQENDLQTALHRRVMTKMQTSGGQKNQQTAELLGPVVTQRVMARLDAIIDEETTPKRLTDAFGEMMGVRQSARPKRRKKSSNAAKAVG